MASNAETDNEEHDIPPYILKTIFGSHIFRPQYVWFPYHL